MSTTVTTTKFSKNSTDRRQKWRHCRQISVILTDYNDYLNTSRVLVGVQKSRKSRKNSSSVTKLRHIMAGKIWLFFRIWQVTMKKLTPSRALVGAQKSPEIKKSLWPTGKTQNRTNLTEQFPWNNGRATRLLKITESRDFRKSTVDDKNVRHDRPGFSGNGRSDRRFLENDRDKTLGFFHFFREIFEKIEFFRKFWFFDDLKNRGFRT